MTARRAARLVLPALCLFFAILFAALGVWQVERLQWKLALIERVERRLAEPAAAIPDRSRWRSFDAKAAEYRRIRATGFYRHDRETLVQALTERGAGYWVMTPLRTDDGTILVNRGFVPATGGESHSRPEGEVAINGLLRVSEPGGRFLRLNRPTEDRWYSRDVEAIATARGLGPVAPFFIDAGAAPNPGELPVGGLTVVRFRNAHLIYALTWFALSALAIFGLMLTLRGERRWVAPAKGL